MPITIYTGPYNRRGRCGRRARNDFGWRYQPIATQLVLTRATGFPQPGSSNSTLADYNCVAIDGEIICWRGISGNTLQNLKRGQFVPRLPLTAIRPGFGFGHAGDLDHRYQQFYSHAPGQVFAALNKHPSSGWPLQRIDTRNRHHDYGIPRENVYLCDVYRQILALSKFVSRAYTSPLAQLVRAAPL
jgi:hypothetical protein